MSQVLPVNARRVKFWWNIFHTFWRLYIIISSILIAGTTSVVLYIAAFKPDLWKKNTLLVGSLAAAPIILVLVNDKLKPIVKAKAYKRGLIPLETDCCKYSLGEIPLEKLLKTVEKSQKIVEEGWPDR